MSDSAREQLLGHLLGALDQPEQESLSARLEGDPELRRELGLMREQLAPLEAARCQFSPPPGLAERTCRFVFSHVRPVASRAQRRSMTPAGSAPSWIGRMSWLDVAITACIVAAASLLIVPAIQKSRFDAQVIACQRNLRDLGMGLAQYSEANAGFFPAVPTRGPGAAAGIYAPVLLRGQYVSEPRRIICPGSPLAQRRDFRPPSLDRIQSARGDELAELRAVMGGSYGYGLGYLANGVYLDRRNLRRPQFAVMADAPSLDRPDRQSLNHGGLGQNVLREDGSVTFISGSRLGDDDIFCNDNGEIAAGTHLNDAVIAPSPTPPLH